MILKDILEKRIAILDGALGTMIQSYNLSESDFRGERFKRWGSDLYGCNDILTFTRADIIEQIHSSYLEAGADIISTNTFNSNDISMSDYQLEDSVYEMNYTSARLAKTLALKYSTIDKPRFVAGSVGPTSRTLSMSPDVERPSFRNITYDDLLLSYIMQIEGLVDGGVDIILVETIFDTLNAKAAIEAHRRVTMRRDRDIPLMLSVTITDASGRTLSGQTIEAFVYSVSHAYNLLSIGINCSFGAELMLPFLEELSSKVPYYVSAHPNAGLPDGFGSYSHTPEKMRETLKPFFDRKLVNIIGGCCGTTPEHITLIAEDAEKYSPREVSSIPKHTTLTGLEVFHITKEVNFVNIGERANVAGSAKFARLIREKRYDEAVEIVRTQVNSGAQIIDICMDDAMIDGVEAMSEFINLLAAEPDISRLPLMIDSSSWCVIEAALKRVQAKSIVNSISLKEGENEFLTRAHMIHSYGAAVVVMLFDEKGQADSYERKIEVAARAYKLLVSTGFPKEDIIFDPNVLTIATGIPEHDSYGIDFIRAVEWIKANCEGVKVSGGVSNLSFSFRGNNVVREAMHAVFLYHAIRAGMDMAIVNAGLLRPYDTIDAELLKAIEDIVLNREGASTERMIELAHGMTAEDKNPSEIKNRQDIAVSDRIVDALVKGDAEYIESDLAEQLISISSPLEIIETVLMKGMNRVGGLFADGKMFLPQVVKSARVMKRAVDFLNPYIKAENSGVAVAKKRVVIATVKGDVHDIGKNIVSIVLVCNGYEIIDLGVMTPSETIIDSAVKNGVEAILLSGLITPSLSEMAVVINEAERRGLTIPIMVGGATTSPLHTAVKLAPMYSSVVVRTSDASECVKVLSRLTSSSKNTTIEDINQKYGALRDGYQQKEMLSVEEARKNIVKLDFSNIAIPKTAGKTIIKNLPISEVRPLINWTSFFHAWQIKGRYPEIFNDPVKGVEAKKLFDDASAMLNEMESSGDITINCIVGLYEAQSVNETVFVFDKRKSCDCCAAQSIAVPLRFDRMLDPKTKNMSCADFIAPRESGIRDYIALFALTAGLGADKVAERYVNEGDDYSALLVKLLCDRLAEATSEYLHYKVRTEIWGYASSEEFEPERLLKGDYRGIRPAFGFSSAPDHTQKRVMFDILNAEKEIGVTLTENNMMIPQSSICGTMFAHEKSRYF